MVHVSTIHMLVCPGTYRYVLTHQMFEYAMFGVVVWDMLFLSDPGINGPGK